jgi:AraC-like DNA-binding protein
MSKRKNPVSDRAVEFILTRKLDQLGALTEISLAHALGVSLSYLSREFKEDQKIDLGEFIVREKIHTAMSLMAKHQDIAIEELAGKLGFPKINQFVDAFKNYIATDPVTYQNLKSNRPLSIPIGN